MAIAHLAEVADSIDAMSSDRPYRKGIPDEKLDSILRDGAAPEVPLNSNRVTFEVVEE